MPRMPSSLYCNILEAFPDPLLEIPDIYDAVGRGVGVAVMAVMSIGKCVARTRQGNHDPAVRDQKLSENDDACPQ